MQTIKLKNTGFTLVELVITLVLVGIIASVVAGLISDSMVAYGANARRAVLVDAAEMALRRMARDIQAALPNSVRVKAGAGSIQAIEFVNVVEGVRYRAQGSTANTFLNFNTADTDFDIIGNFQVAQYSPPPRGYRLVIYNTGAISGGSYDNPVAGVNVYNPATASGTTVPPPGTHVITPASTVVSLTAGANDHVNINPGMQFAFPSPQQRLYVIDTPVTYLCNPNASGGSIFRYSGYALQSIQPVDSSAAPLSTATSNAQLTNNVTACSFTYTAGTTQRNAVITMSISVSQQSETITLMRQISVNNAP